MKRLILLPIVACLLFAAPAFAQDEEVPVYPLTDSNITNFINVMKDAAKWTAGKEKEIEAKTEGIEESNYERALESMNAMVLQYGDEMNSIVTSNGFSDTEHLADVSSRIVNALVAIGLEEGKEASTLDVDKSIDALKESGASDDQVDMIRSLASSIKDAMSEVTNAIPAADIEVVRRNKKRLEDAFNAPVEH